MTYGVIQPLLGGFALGVEKLFNKLPEYVVSYNGVDNDLEYLAYKNINAKFTDTKPFDYGDFTDGLPYVDLIVSTPFCNGASAANSSNSIDSRERLFVNLFNITENALKLKPKVFIFENSPRLKLYDIAKERLQYYADKHNYNLLCYTTNNKQKGNIQNRKRSYWIFTDKYLTPKNINEELSYDLDWVLNTQNNYNNDEYIISINPANDYKLLELRENQAIKDYLKTINYKPIPFNNICYNMGIEQKIYDKYWSDDLPKNKKESLTQLITHKLPFRDIVNVGYTVNTLYSMNFQISILYNGKQYNLGQALNAFDYPLDWTFRKDISEYTMTQLFTMIGQNVSVNASMSMVKSVLNWYEESTDSEKRNEIQFFDNKKR